MTRTQLFPSQLLTEIPLPKTTVTNWIQARSPGGNQTHLNNLVIHLRLTWKFGSYFVTAFDHETGESSGLLGQGPHGRPDNLFWSSWEALHGYIENDFGFERDERWKRITIGELRRL